MQTELKQPGPLLDPSGKLAQIGWSPQPLLDCNLERVAFYPWLKLSFQRFRIKRWDYYAVFTLQRFFSAHIWMLPATLAGLIGVHLYLIIRHGESHFPSKED